MLNVLANTFMNATRTERRETSGHASHWSRGERFDNRRNAELEAHLMGRRT